VLRSAPPAPGRGRDPERWAFYLYAAHLFTLVSISLSNVVTGLAVLATPWVLRRRSREQRWFPPAARPLLAALGLYCLLLFASIAASYEPVVSARNFSELFTLATLVLGLLLVRGERDARRVVDGLVIVAALVAVAGLVQLAGDYGALDRRIRGPFSHWMTFSGFLLVCDLLLLARLAAPHRRGGAGGRAGWRWAAAVVINLALLGSLTRSAWVALIASVTLLVLLRAPRWLLAYLPAAALFVVLAPMPLLARVISISQLGDSSNYDRLCMAEAALHMIAERPVLGLGPDLVELRYPIYRPPSAPRYEVPHLHNTFLQIAAERGLPALASYLCLVALSLAAAWRGFVREGRFAGSRADLYLGALLALVAFNLAGLFENNWGDTEVQRLALFVLALPFCLGEAGPAEPEGEER
jgi:O-antigen ligase